MDKKVDVPVTEKIKISVRNLNFYYGKFHALKNINLELPEKKVYHAYRLQKPARP